MCVSPDGGAGRPPKGWVTFASTSSPWARATMDHDS
jgi:hypothetical protein